MNVHVQSIQAQHQVYDYIFSWPSCWLIFYFLANILVNFLFPCRKGVEFFCFVFFDLARTSPRIINGPFLSMALPSSRNGKYTKLIKKRVPIAVQIA